MSKLQSLQSGQSLQSSPPASINPTETLQDFLTRTALEFKASKMKLNLQHFSIEDNDTANKLLK